jgi:hypothetical protein
MGIQMVDIVSIVSVKVELVNQRQIAAAWHLAEAHLLSGKKLPIPAEAH